MRGHMAVGCAGLFRQAHQERVRDSRFLSDLTSDESYKLLVKGTLRPCACSAVFLFEVFRFLR